MAITCSTGDKQARVGKKALAYALQRATTLAFVDGGAGEDSITDSGTGFVTAGFRAGDTIRILTASGTNDKSAGVIATSVVAGTITVATGTLTTEGAGQQVVLAASRGGSVKDLYGYSVMHIYGSPRPASADDAETGTLLAVITDTGATFTPGAITAGLRFEETPTAGVLEKLSTQTWSTLACLASGTAVWGRIYDNSRTMGASTTAVRRDFSIGTSGADMVGGTTTLTVDYPTGINSFSITAQ